MYKKHNNNPDKIEDNKLKRNGSGAIDMTAYNAIKHADAENEARERHRKLIGCILRIIELSGFTIESKIVVRDNQTGKLWD